MVLTWLLYLLIACICGILAVMSFLYGKKVRKSLQHHTKIIGTVRRREGWNAIVEWTSRGETYVTSPSGLFSLRKKGPITLLGDPNYSAKASVDHWTTNGKMWLVASGALVTLSLGFLVASGFSLFS